MNPPLLMAPMAGVTDSAFRRVLRSLEPGGLIFTEMVSAEALARTHPRTLRLLAHLESERPLAYQLFGPRPEALARAAARLEELGAPLVDLNMGCPARKVVRSGSGCALLNDPDRALSVVRAVRQAIRIPLTVKIRKGRPGREEEVLELARNMESEGIDAITVHGRHSVHSYSEPADWTFVHRAVRALKIPVIGNGDLDSPETAVRRLQESGCQAVMMGRSVLGDPWLFHRTAQVLRGEAPPPRPEPEEREAVLLRHLELQVEIMGDHGIRHFRMMIGPYVRGLPGAAAFRREVYRIDDLPGVRHHVRSFFQGLNHRGEPS